MAAEGGNIKIFVRIRPSRRPSGFFSINPETEQLDFNVPTNVDADLVNNSRTNYKFKFNGMFGMSSSQDDVFDAVAREAVDSALDGYNSTIFAYGQTGSGKTFTITGGAERYQDRGIIPRALGRVFQAFKDRPGMQYSAYISYLEIYNEVGYDLLDPSHETKTLEELPRVSLMEDEEGNVHLKNLTMHAATNEEEALNLLFLGDTNRAIAETPMNMASSRSHCIFTVSIEARQEGSSTVRRSKLHLVDLAGSERVSKTGATGQLFREASHINKSLHFLEMVIVALQEARKGGRTHIPYRNSMMTNVLRDSLGGNCKTTMIATINPEPEHTNESISTCRFAQRVALVKNSAIVNEEADPTLLIRALKTKLQGMEAEVKYLKGEAGEEAELSEADENAIVSAARAYVAGPDGDELSLGKMTLLRIKAAFRALRDIAIERGKGHAGAGSDPAGKPSLSATSPRRDAGGSVATGGAGTASAVAAAGGAGYADDSAAVAAAREEARALRAQLQMRDNEIAILVSMVKAAKASAASSGGAGAGSGHATPAGAASPSRPASSSASATAAVLSAYTPMPPAPSSWTPAGLAGFAAGGAGSAGGMRSSAGAGELRVIGPPPSVSTVAIMLANGVTVGADVLKDREKSLDAFRAAYPKNDTIEENKRVLKEKYDAAKALAERVNRAREETNRLKGDIERRRVERAMASIVEGKEGSGGAGAGAGGGDDAGAGDIIESELMSSMEAAKGEYKSAFAALRDLKGEIEQIQRLLEGARVKMAADFESWYANSLRRLEEAGGKAGADADVCSSSAAGGLSSADSTISGTSASFVGSGGSAFAGGTVPATPASAFSPYAGSRVADASMLSYGALSATGSSGSSHGSAGGASLMPGQVALPALTPAAMFPAAMWGTPAGMMPGMMHGMMSGMMMPGMMMPGMMPGSGMPSGMMMPGMMPGMMMPGMMQGAPGFPAAAAAAAGLPPTAPRTTSAGASGASAGSASHMGMSMSLPGAAAVAAAAGLGPSRPGSGSATGAFPSLMGTAPPLTSASAASGLGPAAGATAGSSGGIPLTGNAAADADIMAFYKAREELLRKRQAGSAGSAGATDGLGVGGGPPGSAGSAGSARPPAYGPR